MFDGTFDSLVNKPITLEGYGITDSSHGRWNELTNTPTTLLGYGITDAVGYGHVAYGITQTDIESWNNAYRYSLVDQSQFFRDITWQPTWSDILNKPDFSTLGGGGGGGVSVHGLLSGLDYASSGHTGFVSSATYTAVDVFAKVLTQDGTGTGLDADLLDGQQGNYYLSTTGTAYNSYRLGGALANTYAPLANPIFTGTVDVNGDGIFGVNTGARLNLNGTSLGFNREVATGGIYSSTGYAYQFEHTGRTVATADMLCLEVYDTTGTQITNKAISVNGLGYVGIGVNYQSVTLQVGGTGIKSDIVQSATTYSTGFAGDGYKVIETSGDTTAEFDNLIVRKAMKIYELQINKISAVNGGLIISCANGKSISLTGTTKIWFDTNSGKTPIQFIDNDWIRAQQWDNPSYHYFQAQVTSDIGSNYIVVDNITGTPWATMDLVQVGHPTNTARQSIIYITSADTNNPYIQMLSGVTDGNFTAARTRVLLGKLDSMASTGIVPATPGFGLFSDNVYLSGKVVASSGTIGGWVIGSNYFQDAAGTVGMSSVVTGGNDIRFWAGSSTPSMAPFIITKSGAMSATSGTIANWNISTSALSNGAFNTNGTMYLGTSGISLSDVFNVTAAGALTALSGTIGGWTINSAYLAKDTGTAGTSAGMVPTDYPFYAGATYANRASAPFRVTNSGYTIATKFLYKYILSDSIIASNDTIHWTTSNSIQKVKVLTIGSDLQGPETLRVVFTLRANNSGIVHGQIFRNSSPVGTSRSATSTGSTFSEDISGWSAGDNIELWCYAEDYLVMAEYSNFRLLGSFIQIANEVTATNTYDYNYI